MRLDDISHSIFTKDVREIERAYRVLAAYPNEETIPDACPENLMAALDNVATALTDNRRIMPSETCEAASLRPGATYADGAAHFLDNRQWWLRKFQSAMGGR